MELTTPRVRTLLRQAERVEAAGKRAAAEDLYRQILDEMPESPEAWRGLARVINDPAEKASAEQRAIELDPEGVTLPSEPVKETAPEESPAEALAEDRVPARTPAPAEIPPPPPIARPRPQEREVRGEPAAELLACYRHPGRETSLRCNRCGRPICSSCARPTPVGYRCPECIREQEDAFFSARPIDYVLVTLVAVPLSLVGALVASAIGWFALFLGAGLGGLIGKASFRVAGRRRGRFLPFVVAAAVVVGALPFALRALAGGNLFGLLLLGVYVAVAAGSAFYWMK